MVFATAKAGYPAGAPQPRSLGRERTTLNLSLDRFTASRGMRAAQALLIGLALIVPPHLANAASRIKDIADFEGVRENPLVGYGLIVGVNGTGDKLTNSGFTRQSLIGMLERLGVNSRDDPLKTKNVAAVMVTANLPPFARQGTYIDVTVSAMGDATDLMGGTLLVTPLLGADGEVYAVGQGPVAIAGFSASGQGGTVTKGVPTSARIANGAVIEREIPFQLAEMTNIKVALRNPDFTTSQRIAEAINGYFKSPIARSLDPSTVSVAIPPQRAGDVAGVMTEIEQLEVNPDQVARVIIDERSGVIVMGDNVRISTVAIAQGNLTIRVTETPQVSQPSPFSNTGTTTTVPRTQIDVDEGQGKKLAVVKNGVSLQELVNGLNALGISPRDMITILQAIKAAGALQADIQVM
jgi:flagellar P-ring protein precursor FlgI